MAIRHAHVTFQCNKNRQLLSTFHCAVVTCEIKVFWNNSANIWVFYFTCKRIWNWNKIIPVDFSRWRNSEISSKLLRKYFWAEIFVANHSISLTRVIMLQLLLISDLRPPTYFYIANTITPNSRRS